MIISLSPRRTVFLILLMAASIPAAWSMPQLETVVAPMTAIPLKAAPEDLPVPLVPKSEFVWGQENRIAQGTSVYLRYAVDYKGDELVEWYRQYFQGAQWTLSRGGTRQEHGRVRVVQASKERSSCHVEIVSPGKHLAGSDIIIIYTRK